jgi:NTP pyrophosphatase (non-canonical NTP hydrolase)
MKYSRETVVHLQLDEYVEVVPKIYGRHDRNRTIWDVWCHTLHHAAAVIERIRKSAPADELHKEVADFALWLFTAVHKLTGGLGESRGKGETPRESLVRIASSCSDLLWHRYPGVCHLCYARWRKTRWNAKLAAGFSRCDCPPRYADSRDKEAKRCDSEALLRLSEANRAKKPKTIDQWQGMFGTIFGDHIHRLSPADIALHLMEELGEVSDALVRMYSYTEKDFRPGEPNWRQARLEAQIADVFSWLFTLVERLEQPRGKIRKRAAKADLVKPITLSGIIWERYGSDALHAFYCPACGRPMCACPLIFVPATRSKHELLEKFSCKHPWGRKGGSL